MGDGIMMERSMSGGICGQRRHGQRQRHTAMVNGTTGWTNGTPWSTAAATAHGQQSIQRHDQTGNNQPHSMEAWSGTMVNGNGNGNGPWSAI
jgi:hypothetical protein